MRTTLSRTIPRIALLLAVAQPALPSAQTFTEADWPTRGRNAERHYSTPFELGLNAQGRLNLKWKRFFGARIESEMEPVVVGDTVYLGVINGKFYALDRETGAILTRACPADAAQLNESTYAMREDFGGPRGVRTSARSGAAAPIRLSAGEK